MKTGIELITIERQEQIEKHGYDLDHDILHRGDYDDMDTFPSSYQSPLLSAALAFLNVDGEVDVNEGIREADGMQPPIDINAPELYVPRKWPWADEEWLGENKTKIERLIIAGALIAAEIDRLNHL